MEIIKSNRGVDKLCVYVKKKAKRTGSDGSVNIRDQPDAREVLVQTQTTTVQDLTSDTTMQLTADWME